MIDTNTVNQISGSLNQIVVAVNAIILVIGTIASFIAGHNHGRKTEKNSQATK